MDNKNVTTVVNLSETIADKCNITKKLSREIVDNVFQAVSRELASGNKVQIKNFGTFDVYIRKARTVIGFERNKIEVPAKTSMRFTASDALKNAVKALPAESIG